MVKLNFVNYWINDKENYGGIGFGRQAGLIFIASIGLIFNVHTIRPEVSGLLGFALAFLWICFISKKAV